MNRLCPLLLLVVLSLACGGETPHANARTATATATATAPRPAAPSPADVRPIIANSAELGDHEFTKAGYTLLTARSMMNAPAKAAAKALQRGGWAEISGDNLVLSSKAKNDPRFLMRPNGSLDVVPLARKEMGEVTAVRITPTGDAEADFTWRWVPNELGTLLAPERFEGEQRATATLVWNGSKWSMVQVVKSGT